MISENQVSFKEKIQDLKESLNIRNLNWSEWEIKFIRSLNIKNKVSKKQGPIIDKLWERI